MNDKEWEEETRRRLNLVSKYFKPQEVVVIFDFITTAKDVSKEEKEE